MWEGLEMVSRVLQKALKALLRFLRSFQRLLYWC